MSSIRLNWPNVAIIVALALTWGVAVAALRIPWPLGLPVGMVVGLIFPPTVHDW